MNSYASLRKKNNGTALAVVALALCVVLSATVLFSRLVEYSAPDTCHYIPLTRSSGITTVLTGQVDENGDICFAEAAAYNPQQPIVLAYSPFLTADWFQVSDENTVWQGQTDIEIFRLSYENGEGRVTVNSQRGDKVLAPGTSNTYSFALENTGSNAVRYEMTMEAYFTNGTCTIPVNARVTKNNADYLAGSAEAYADVLALNDVSDSGTLFAGYVMPYTLEWEWPFEEDDAYDTMLGDLAVGEDISLTIVINTVASYTPDPPSSDGNPKTGDTSHIGMMLALMIVSAAALLFLLPLYRRKGEENAEA